MDISALLLFAGVYALAVASPGPAVAVLVARGLSQGGAGAFAFIAGFVVGDIIWLGFAALGLGTIAALYAPLFQLIKYAGAAYLIYLAVKIWRAPAAPIALGTAAEEGGWRLFFGSLTLTLGNPKVIAFFLSIMPLVVDVNRIGTLAFAELAVVIAFVMAPIFLAYTLLAARARRFLRSERSIRAANRCTAAMMAGTAALVASR